jgi:hypothetical protein
MRKGLAALACLCLAAIAIYFLNPFTSADRSERPVRIGSVPQPTVSFTQSVTIHSTAPPVSQVIGASTAAAPTAAQAEVKTSGSELTAATAAIVEPPANETEATNLPPNVVLENMRSTIRDYGSRLGGNPVGTNPEITAALNGANPKQITFIRPGTGLRINSRGELVDSWGTPFFFHQLSASSTEIHSAGPDKKMWTADDLVTK